MKIINFDCFSGISGDMLLGAFLDIGIEKEILLSLPKKLKLEQVKVDINKVNKNGISATKVDIIFPHEHVHRHLSDIEKIIDDGELDERVKILSKKIFNKLAKAEADVHGTTLEKIHFHEVGALDAIFDIVGASSCFVALGIEAAFTGTISVGGGMVKMAHGLYPVPAPATSFLLNGFSIAQGPVEKELVTPTGAAILSALVNEPQKRPSFTLIKSGFGAGSMTHENVPNVLRISTGESDLDVTKNEALMIETNIDDMNPQLYPILISKLFRAGANDAYLTPILMKKGRPAHTLSVLCDKKNESELLKVIYHETTTIGVRSYEVIKSSLNRKLIKMKTSLGEIQVKEITLPDNSIKRMPEFDNCVKIADEMKVAVKFVYDKVFSEIN
jgi:pyridinium-3,5-bisthiocarboxylic acid mononucleotide nickel chelatase